MEISSIIAGSYDDFAITSGVKEGHNNLPEHKSGGDKTLKVNVNNSDIALNLTR